MTSLSDLGLTLADVDLGAINAEADHNLHKHFLHTSYTAGLLEDRCEFILGRKGSGKSALFKRLVDVLPEDVVVKQVTPAGIWSTLKEQQDLANPNPDASFIHAWSFVIALLSAQAVLSADRELSPEARLAFNPAHRFLEKNAISDSSPVAVARAFVKRIHSLNFEALGIGIGVSLETNEVNEVAAVVADKVMEAIYPAIREIGLVLAFDQVDEGWDGSQASRSMMIGLLRATKRLNDSYGFRAGKEKHLRVMVFLRSDIYDSLVFDEKDKHRPHELQISWDLDSLRAMIDKRLPEGVTTSDLIVGGMRGGGNPFNYLVSRTFMRPREVLQLLQAAKKDAGTESNVIAGEDVKTAEKRYSVWKVEDLKTEYRKADPTVAMLLESLRQGVHRYDSVEELEQLLKETVPSLIQPPLITARSLVEKLFEYSVIGVRLGNSGSPRYKAEEPSLTLPVKGAVYVHPALYKGLLITEARAPRRQ